MTIQVAAAAWARWRLFHQLSATVARATAGSAGADAFVPKSRVARDLLPTLNELFPQEPSHGEAAA